MLACAVPEVDVATSRGRVVPTTASDLGNLDDNRHFNVLFQWPIAEPRRKPAIPKLGGEDISRMLACTVDGSG
jgi:hypothetical protein